MAAGRGASNVLKKLEKSVEDGDFYSAQQMYKTLFHRNLSQKKYKEAKEILMSGIMNMLKHKQCSCGSELALLMINQLYPAAESPADDDVLGDLKQIDDAFGDDTSVGRVQFMKAALRWMAKQGTSSSGPAELHTRLAHLFWKQKDFASAQRHFVRSTDPQGFSKMIIEWQKGGYQSEQDLFIARAVLQYLALHNLRDANIVFDEVMKQPDSPNSPLINFIKFLLLTLERNALPLYNVLVEKYRPSIRRDPAFQQYLDHIAHLFYGVSPPANLSNFIGDLLNNFLGDSAEGRVSEDVSDQGGTVD